MLPGAFSVRDPPGLPRWKVAEEVEGSDEQAVLALAVVRSGRAKALK